MDGWMFGQIDVIQVTLHGYRSGVDRLVCLASFDPGYCSPPADHRFTTLHQLTYKFPERNPDYHTFVADIFAAVLQFATNIAVETNSPSLKMFLNSSYTDALITSSHKLWLRKVMQSFSFHFIHCLKLLHTANKDKTEQCLNVKVPSALFKRACTAQLGFHFQMQSLYDPLCHEPCYKW